MDWGDMVRDRTDPEAWVAPVAVGSIVRASVDGGPSELFVLTLDILEGLPWFSIERDGWAGGVQWFAASAFFAPVTVMDVYTMRAIEKSLRARAMSHPYAANGRPWKLGADHVKEMIEKGKP
jgi:hypothetical protein